MTIDTVARPAPALHESAQRIANLAASLGLHPVIQDRWPDDPPETEVPLLTHATDHPDQAEWILVAPDDGRVLLYGPAEDDDDLGVSGESVGEDAARAALLAVLGAGVTSG